MAVHAKQGVLGLLVISLIRQLERPHKVRIVIGGSEGNIEQLGARLAEHRDSLFDLAQILLKRICLPHSEAMAIRSRRVQRDACAVMLSGQIRNTVVTAQTDSKHQLPSELRTELAEDVTYKASSVLKSSAITALALFGSHQLAQEISVCDFQVHRPKTRF